MEELTRRVKHVLAVYLERGMKAVEALGQCKVDEAREILTLRNAAFHNLRAVDHEALQRGADAAQDPEVQALWDETRRIDTALNAALIKARDEAARQHLKVKRAREKIGKYKAGQGDEATFTKTA